MRLIDADGILKADENSDKALVLGSGKALEIAYALLKKKVADAPTVDAVVVTRCKDCCACGTEKIYTYFAPKQTSCFCRLRRTQGHSFAALARERTAGMAKQSAYLQRRDAQLDAVFWAGATMAAQFAVDTLQMTMHQQEGWGYDRIMRVTHEWMETQREYRPALNCKDPEADVRQVHMDRVLAEIIRGKAKLIPFPDRYKDLKKIRYGR